MSVYFAYSMRGNLMKIGSAVQPKRRVAHLRATTGLPLQILLVLPGDVSTERKYQARFIGEAIPQTEYFYFYGSLMEFILGFDSAAAALKTMQAHRYRTAFHDDDVVPVIRGQFKNVLRKPRARLSEEGIVPGGYVLADALKLRANEIRR